MIFIVNFRTLSSSINSVFVGVWNLYLYIHNICVRHYFVSPLLRSIRSE